jgi:hypothetical protein
VILSVFSIGSVPPVVIAQAAEQFGGCAFVVDPKDDQAMDLYPLLDELGQVIVSNDVASCVAALRGRSLLGVVTFADRGIRMTSDLAHHFGLPGLSTESAEWCSNKISQRRRLNLCGVGNVQSFPMEGRELPAEVRFPAIVKPTEGAGSEDTFYVYSAHEYASLFNQISESRAYVVEEYIEGIDTRFGPWLSSNVSIESAVDASGLVKHMGITLRLPLAPLLLRGF